MKFKVFYDCGSTDEFVDSESPVELGIEEIIDLVGKVLKEEDDFLGIIDKEDVAIQFIMIEDGTIWLDIPIPEKNGSFGKNIELSEVENIIRSQSDPFDYNKIPDLEFEEF